MVAEPIQTTLSIDKSGWKKVTLGDVVREVRETAKDPVAEGLERVIGLEHLEPESLHIKTWGSIANATTFTKKFRKGQMLFGRRRAYLKKAALATFDGICSGDITVLEAKNGLLPELLPFLIQNDKFFDLAIKNSAGSLSPRAKFNDFADYELLLPPKDQQAQIAELLWAGDEMIERERVSLKAIKNVIDPCLKRIVDSSEHIYVTLGELVKENDLEMLTGPFGTVLSAKEYSNSGVPIINPNHLSDGQIDNTKGPFVPYSLLGKLSKYIMKLDDIIVGRKGEVGRSAIISHKSDGYLVGSDCIRFRLNSKQVLAKYLFIYVNLKSSQEWFERYSYGTTMPGINEKTLHKFSLPIPAIENQNIIIDTYTKLDNSTRMIEDKICRSQNLQKSLINQFF